MDEIEFMNAVQRVYATAIERGRTPAQAHKEAEVVRSNLRIALAQASLDRLEKRKREESSDVES